MPQIGLVWPRFSSIATTAPIWRAASEPITAGHASPVLFTQSMPSSFVRNSGFLNPCSVVARKFEQKRCQFSLDPMAYEACRTPPVF